MPGRSRSRAGHTAMFDQVQLAADALGHLRERLAVHVVEHGREQQQPADRPGPDRVALFPLGAMAHPVPASAVPGRDALEEGDDVVGEDAEEHLPLLGGGHARVADVARRASILGDPALRCGLERQRRADRRRLGDRSPTRCGASRSIIDVSHSQAWPMRVCSIERVDLVRLAAEAPVGRRQQEQVVALAVAAGGSRRRPAARARCCRRGRSGARGGGSRA